jgi:hypothetical protein
MYPLHKLYSQEEYEYFSTIPIKLLPFEQYINPYTEIEFLTIWYESDYRVWSSQQQPKKGGELSAISV